MKLFQRLFLSILSAGGAYYLSLLLDQDRSNSEKYAIYAAIAVALAILAYSLSKLLTEPNDDRTISGAELHKILAAPKVHSRDSQQREDLSTPAEELSTPVEELSRPEQELSQPAEELSTPEQDLSTPAPVAYETREPARAGGRDSSRNDWEGYGGLAVLLAVLLGLGGVSLLATKLAALGVMLLVAGGGIIRLLMNGAFDHDEREALRARRRRAGKEQETRAAEAFEKMSSAAEDVTQAATTPDPVMDAHNPADARWLALAAKRDAMVEAALKDAERNFLLSKRDH